MKVKHASSGSIRTITGPTAILTMNWLCEHIDKCSELYDDFRVSLEDDPNNTGRYPIVSQHELNGNVSYEVIGYVYCDGLERHRTNDVLDKAFVTSSLPWRYVVDDDNPVNPAWVPSGKTTRLLVVLDEDDFQHGLCVGCTLVDPKWEINAYRPVDKRWAEIPEDAVLAVFEVDENDLKRHVTDYKILRGKVVYLGDGKGIRDHVDQLENISDEAAVYLAIRLHPRCPNDVDVLRRLVATSKDAYRWAIHIGDHNIMRDRVKDSSSAYDWIMNIGDLDVMIDRVTDEEHVYNLAHTYPEYRERLRDRIEDSRLAYYWARRFPEDADIVKHLVIEPEWAYYWALNIGDRDVMIDRVTDSKSAFAWALDIGDHDVMRDRVTDTNWVAAWIVNIGDREVMVDRIPCGGGAFDNDRETSRDTRSI